MKIFYSKQLWFWPSTTRSARHSASPNWLVARTLYVPASSRNTSGMTRKLFWYMCEIWKSREGWISTPSRYQRISGVGKPVKLTSILTNNSWCKTLQLIMNWQKKTRWWEQAIAQHLQTTPAHKPRGNLPVCCLLFCWESRLIVGANLPTRSDNKCPNFQMTHALMTSAQMPKWCPKNAAYALATLRSHTEEKFRGVPVHSLDWVPLLRVDAGQRSREDGRFLLHRLRLLNDTMCLVVFVIIRHVQHRLGTRDMHLRFDVHVWFVHPQFFRRVWSRHLRVSQVDVGRRFLHLIISVRQRLLLSSCVTNEPWININYQCLKYLHQWIKPRMFGTHCNGGSDLQYTNLFLIQYMTNTQSLQFTWEIWLRVPYPGFQTQGSILRASRSMERNSTRDTTAFNSSLSRAISQKVGRFELGGIWLGGPSGFQAFNHTSNPYCSPNLYCEWLCYKESPVSLYFSEHIMNEFSIFAWQIEYQLKFWKIFRKYFTSFESSEFNDRRLGFLESLVEFERPTFNVLLLLQLSLNNRWITNIITIFIVSEFN